MTPHDPTSNPAESLLEKIAREALEDGRPVLIVPPEISQTEDASVRIAHDEEQRPVAYIPEGIAVIFADPNGFACASSQLSGTDSLAEPFVSNRSATEARGARSADDSVHLKQSLYQSSCLSTEQLQNMKNPERRRR